MKKIEYTYTVFADSHRIDKPGEKQRIQKTFDSFELALKAVVKLGREYVMESAEILVTDNKNDQVDYRLQFDVSEIQTLTIDNDIPHIRDSQDNETILTILNCPLGELAGCLEYIKMNFPAIFQRVYESEPIKNRMRNDYKFCHILNDIVKA